MGKRRQEMARARSHFSLARRTSERSGWVSYQGWVQFALSPWCFEEMSSPVERFELVPNDMGEFTNGLLRASSGR
ncbi:hypothetical protein LJ739_16265 [Aestuariibacter halophilus]|uniref:Uncharacterized protein n=1 Tax=Fluctibacter halophilus TaxID=226011 RepID=A0ABS8GB47_9ALTE|nr:hypothetical protein [Aestuariibacter halophilus]MCC2617807.1 hypothetical protein [Aestuariibacter halophilus]